MKIVNFCYYYCFLSGLVAPVTTLAQVYKSIDAEGHIRYSDASATLEKSETIVIPQIAPPTPIVPASPSEVEQPSKPDSEKSHPVTPQKYQSMTIITPTNQSSTYGNEPVPLAIRLIPPLQSEHTIVVNVDGKKIAGPEAKTHFLLQGIHRGEHTITVQVWDKDGKKQIEATSTVYVFRPFIRKRALPKPSPQ